MKHSGAQSASDVISTGDLCTARSLTGWFACDALGIRSDTSGQGVFPTPIGPTRARIPYEVTLEFACATNTSVFASSPDEALISRARWHRTRAFPLKKSLVRVGVYDLASALGAGAPCIYVVHQSAIDSRLVHEALACIVKENPIHHANIDGPLCSKLLHVSFEDPAKVRRELSGLQ